MLLGFDIDAEAVAEHDDWHTHEHLPERLAIPGFLRGTRWVALEGRPAYLVLYEVERLETLASAAYRERLDHPTPWTTRMMAHYRGMTRGLCTVAASQGPGLGGFALLVRLRPAPGREAALGAWLTGELVPGLPARRGLGSVHWLRSALAPEMTTEQRIRGADAGVDWALLVTGYEPRAVAALAQAELGVAALQARGAADVTCATYQAAYTLTAREVGA
jgi:hypothetical protein